ncbi:MAG TPA: carboxypeptidase-like regulatory domain-containing protein [Bryobacteraceae bacterium]|nr:carboxypeptidase-like regulatory domain-containing protein [Bryobacteraceae bacterium]
MWLFITLLALAPLVAAQSPNPSLVPIPNLSEPQKSARVSGMVVDQQDNRPLSHVVVCFTPFRDGYSDGTGGHCDETDMRGVFRIADLPPGRLQYGVTRSGFFAAEPLAVDLPSLLSLNAGDELRDIKLQMIRAGVIAGRVLYADGEPFSGAFLTASGAQTATNDLGEYRFANLRSGDYSVKVQPQGNPRNQVVDCEQFAARNTRIYVEEFADRPAPPVHVAAGQTAIQPDFVMVQVTPRRVSGRIVWDPYPLPGPWLVHGADQTVQSRASDGTFSFCGVPPGEYTLDISAIVEGRKIAGDVKIRVAGEDLKGMEIAPDVSAVIRAGIDVEGDVPLDLSHAEIVGIYMSGGEAAPNPHNSVPQARPGPDGTFLIQELYTGEYRFLLSPLPAGAYLKSVELEGRELIDAPVMVHAGDAIDGLIFTVSTKAGMLNGIVKDETGAAVPDAIVMLQPDPRHPDPDIHRCFQTADQNGAFTCPNLAPGKYRIAAWRTVLEGTGLQLRETLSSSGTPVEIPEGGDVAITVPLLKP